MSEKIDGCDYACKTYSVTC